jgi:CheY-like chemotaxis protein
MICSGKLLVVDDSPVIRRILGKYLSNLSCKYQLCSDGEEALAWFHEHHDDCAAIITDLEMPRIGGDVLISSAKAVNPFLPCFIVSGNEIPFLRLPTGTRRAIVKPITAECIQSVVEEIYAVQQEREADVLAAAAAMAGAQEEDRTEGLGDMGGEELVHDGEVGECEDRADVVGFDGDRAYV